MRVLMISHMVDSGGVGKYVHNLAKELVKNGIETAYLYSGKYDFFYRPRLQWRKTGNNIIYISLVNSPNTYPAVAITHPRDQIKSEVIEDKFLEIIKDFRPDLIHIHYLAGFCSSLIDLAFKHNIPVINSLHNYWYICPRVELFDHRSMSICPGPNNGLNCSKCALFNPILLHKAKTRLRVQSIKDVSKRLLSHKLIDKFRKVRAKRQERAIKIQNNTSNSAVKSESLISDYVYRERYHRNLLSKKVSVNLAVSSFVKTRFESFGIPSDKIIVQHIGTKAAEFLNPTGGTGNPYITFGYIGPLTVHKGAHVLVDAFMKLKKGKARLIIYGYNPSNDYAKHLKQLSADFPIDFRAPYNYTNLQQVLSDIDIVVVPPIWYDNAPQVVFEALATRTPVIGSNIGGIPDFIKDGKNGFLFEAGDVEELKNKMAIIMENPSLINELKSEIQPMKTMEFHAKEMIDLYRSVLSEA